MYTQCPKCQSVFMVSDTDITAHEGLVRCGNCYSVFNASANLTDDPNGEADAVTDPAEPMVSATTVELPPGAATISTSSDFTFNFVEEPDDTAPQEPPTASDEAETQASQPEEPEPDQDDALNPFPEPDFATETIQEEASPPVEDESSSLLYFGPEDADAASPEPEPANEPEIDTTLLQDAVFNPVSLAAQGEPGGAADDIAADLDQVSELQAEPAETGPASDLDIDDDVTFTGPEITQDTAETGDDFAMPDFSPLEGLEPGQPVDLTAATTETADQEEGTADEGLQHVETHLDDEALWPGAEFAEEPVVDEDDTLPDPQSDQRFLADDTHEALKAFDDAMANMGLANPGEEPETDDAAGSIPDTEKPTENPFADLSVDEDLLALDEPRDEPVDSAAMPASGTGEAAAPVDAEEADGADEENVADGSAEDDREIEDDEPDSVFITSEEDRADEAYPSINVENDDAFHSGGNNDLPLPDELDDFESVDHSDIEKLLQQAADGQEEIDAKLAEAAPDEPDIGTPDIDDDLDDEPQLNPAAQAPEPEDRSGLMQRMGAGIAFVADKLRIGRRSYHGLDTYETQEHQETLLVRQLEHDSHGSPFDFISPGARRILLLVTNLILIIALLFQVGKYFMDDLVQVSALRPVLETACQLAGCVVPEASNPAAVEQLSSKMTVLDGQQDGLRIAVTLINRDDSEQPFPDMELSLTDRAGKIISRNIVRAESYLGSAAGSRTMQPGQAEDINILLRTPAVRVDGFELRPVKLHWLDKR